MKISTLFARVKKGLLAPEFIMVLVIIAIVMILVILFLARAREGVGGQVETISNILGLD